MNYRKILNFQMALLVTLPPVFSSDIISEYCHQEENEQEKSQQIESQTDIKYMSPPSPPPLPSGELVPAQSLLITKKTAPLGHEKQISIAEQAMGVTLKTSTIDHEKFSPEKLKILSSIEEFKQEAVRKERLKSIEINKVSPDTIKNRRYLIMIDEIITSEMESSSVVLDHTKQDLEKQAKDIKKTVELARLEAQKYERFKVLHQLSHPDQIERNEKAVLLEKLNLSEDQLDNLESLYVLAEENLVCCTQKLDANKHCLDDLAQQKKQILQKNNQLKKDLTALFRSLAWVGDANNFFNIKEFSESSALNASQETPDFLRHLLVFLHQELINQSDFTTEINRKKGLFLNEETLTEQQLNTYLENLKEDLKSYFSKLYQSSLPIPVQESPVAASISSESNASIPVRTGLFWWLPALF